MMPSVMLGTQQASMLLGMAPSAGFAKYVRNKPHLNVGTIGKYLEESVDRPPC